MSLFENIIEAGFYMIISCRIIFSQFNRNLQWSENFWISFKQWTSTKIRKKNSNINSTWIPKLIVHNNSRLYFKFCTKCISWEMLAEWLWMEIICSHFEKEKHIWSYKEVNDLAFSSGWPLSLPNNFSHTDLCLLFHACSVAVLNNDTWIIEQYILFRSFHLYVFFKCLWNWHIY